MILLPVLQIVTKRKESARKFSTLHIRFSALFASVYLTFTRKNSRTPQLKDFFMTSLRISIVIGLLAACSSGSIFGQVDCEDNFFYTNNETGSDSNNGTQGAPFATIQKLITEVEECLDIDNDSNSKIGRVVATATPYRDTSNSVNSQFVAAGVFAKGGNSDSERLVLEGFPNGNRQRPIIDQNFAALGFYIDSFTLNNTTPTEYASFITIRNFEIRNSGTGIFTDPFVNDQSGDNSTDNREIIIENNYIHHIYGADNVGGIRLDSCNLCVVRNNIIHDTYDTRNGPSRINDRPYIGHSAIHGFEPANSVIEKNIFFNHQKGIFIKSSDQHGGSAHIVQNNIIHTIAESAFVIQIKGNGAYAPEEAIFRNNVVKDASGGMALTVTGATNTGRNVLFYNNTLIDSHGIGGVQRVQDIEVFNNIVYGSTTAWQENNSALQLAINADTASTINPNTAATFEYYDNNAYFDYTNAWVIDRNGSNEMTLNSSEWMSFNLDNSGNPDQENLFDVEPNFNDAQNGDYTISGPSSLLNNGRGTPYPDQIGAGVSIAGSLPFVLTNRISGWDGNATGTSSTQLGPDAGIFDDIPMPISNFTLN